MNIVIDAFGGDNAPLEVIKGSIDAQKDFGVDVTLVGDEEKIKACQAAKEAGADFVKTSTGFSTAGATFEDVKLMHDHVGEGVKVKAAGGISSFDDAEKFMSLGADRLGTSRLVKIMKNTDNGAGY